MTGGNVINRPKSVIPPLIFVLYFFNGYNLCFCVTLHLRARVDVLIVYNLHGYAQIDEFKSDLTSFFKALSTQRASFK